MGSSSLRWLYSTKGIAIHKALGVVLANKLKRQSICLGVLCCWKKLWATAVAKAICLLESANYLGAQFTLRLLNSILRVLVLRFHHPSPNPGSGLFLPVLLLVSNSTQETMAHCLVEQEDAGCGEMQKWLHLCWMKAAQIAVLPTSNFLMNPTYFIRQMWSPAHIFCDMECAVSKNQGH